MDLLKFAREGKKWYIVLPEWRGRKAALQMISGADTLLNYIAEGKLEVVLYVDEEDFDGAECMTLIEKCFWNGAFYRIETYKNNELNLKLWLCDVTKVVLGEFPEKIYFSKVN